MDARSMDIRAIAFMAKLAFDYPALFPTFEEHFRDNEGVLPHVLMARFADQIEARAQEGWIEDFLTELNKNLLRFDDAVSNVIALSFAHYLGDNSRTRVRVEKLKLLSLLSEYQRFSGPYQA